MLANDSLYHDATLFDQLFAWSRHYLAQSLPASRHQRWGRFFYGFSLLLGSIGVLLAIIGFQQDTQAATAAHLIGTLLLGFAAHHFLHIARQTVNPPTRAKQSLQTAPTATPIPGTRPVASKRPKVSPHQFFKAVRAAGVNVKIARALYCGGIQSADILNSKSDRELLAIHGVGPATVRKLRGYFTRHPDNIPG